MTAIGSSVYYPQFDQTQSASMAAFAYAHPLSSMYQQQYGSYMSRCSDRLHQCFSGCVSGVGMVAFWGQSRIEDDPHGISQSGQGMKSNLANSPEVMLAIKDIMSDGQSHSFDDIAKTLKEKYGINAEVGDVTSVGKDGKEVKGKGLKFANGDYFIDGNGNGSLDQGDYKFDDAIKSLKEKYNLTDDGLKGITDRMKSNASMGQGNDPQGGMPYFGVAMLGSQQSLRPLFFNPMMNQSWMSVFSMAFQYAA